MKGARRCSACGGQAAPESTLLWARLQRLAVDLERDDNCGVDTLAERRRIAARIREML